MMTISQLLRTTQSLNNAFWCNTALYPDWKRLPYSSFDREHICLDKMLEFKSELNYSGKGDIILHFSAGCRFRLLINGLFVEDGPVEIGGDFGKKDAPNWWFVDKLSISHLLHTGKNRILFQVIPAGLSQMDYSLGFGWIWCAIEKQGKIRPIPAEKWLCRINSHYISRSCANFTVQEADWKQDCTAVNIQLQTYNLNLPHLTNHPRTDFQILFPFGKESNIRATGKTIHIKTGTPATFLLKYPNEICGHFELSWHGSHEAAIHLDFQELKGISQGIAIDLVTSNTPGSFRTASLHAFRCVQITVTPSFFSSENNSEEAILNFTTYERHFPVKKYAPLKQLSPTVQKIDALCLRNVIMCMQRMHLDSPIHQEGLGCIGDYRIEALAEYAAFNETRLAEADIIRTALLLRQQKKLFHTSYELCYIFMMEEYLNQTGNAPLLEECYDVLKQIYHRFHSFTGRTGLISEAENYLFIDWIVDGSYSYHHPSASRGTGAMTALWYGALLSLARMALLIHKDDDAALYNSEAELVRLSFNRELWDEKLQCYKDGIPGLSRQQPNRWLPQEDGRTTCTSLTSIMALAFHIPDPSQNPEKLLQRLVEGKLPLRPTVYYMFYLFQAVEQYGLLKKYASKLMAQWKVFLKTGLRESWTSGDYSHGWGAAPAIFLRKLYHTKR